MIHYTGNMDELRGMAVRRSERISDKKVERALWLDGALWAIKHVKGIQRPTSD